MEHNLDTSINLAMTSIFVSKFTLDADVLVHTLYPQNMAKIISIPSYDHPDKKKYGHIFL